MVRLVAGFVATLLALSLRAAEPVALHWLDGKPPATEQGASFGVPWAEGRVAKGTELAATDSAGGPVPLQSWPMAYWPDGSLKWTGHAVPPTAAGRVTILPGKPAAPAVAVEVTQDGDAVTVKNGATIYRLPKVGTTLVESIVIDGTVVARSGGLVCSLEDRTDYANRRTTREIDFVGELARVTVEQGGPVRAVVKLEGTFKSASRSFLPFVVRLYFTADSPTVRVIHTIVFDGDAEKDFICSLGVRFAVPLRDEAHNRHVRLAGDDGLFAEPIRVMAGRRNPTPELYAKQISGEAVPRLADLQGAANVTQMPVWADFKLAQLSSESFSIHKRTGDQSAWIHAHTGKRSAGLAFVGDSKGGMAVSLKNFWQSHPTALEVTGAGSDVATVTAYLWSPDSPAMDLRHYSTQAHGLEASYEDIEQGFSTPHGIARTHELTFTPFAKVPSNDVLLNLARPTPLLVSDPAYYHSVGAFGVWSLPDRSSPAEALIESQLEKLLSFYQTQIDQHHWYGFWDYGDVMHTYDATRHQWKYDVGGYAWANTELMPDLWLWYSFLRTGRADVFRMAEAMTRHTQEVDVYHLGRFAGLGSRHNVRHWGDGAKELRISQAYLKRFHYYLTTDERGGDLIAEVYDADKRMVDVDPLRKIESKGEHPTHARIGPDWLAMYGNWMTAYERTGEKKYLDKAMVGMRDIVSFPRRFFSGDAHGYDPATGHLYLLHPDKTAIPHLAALMGGPEVCMEFNRVANVPEWDEAWLQYCRLLQAPADEQRKELGGTVTHGRGPHFARMTAYAARATKNPELAKRAWQEFFGKDPERDRFPTTRVAGPHVPSPLSEIPNISTNDAAQWSLNAIQLLELIGGPLP
jgi:hypothetical protein